MFSSGCPNLVIKSELQGALPIHQCRQGPSHTRELPSLCRTLLTNLRASMGEVYVRHWPWGNELCRFVCSCEHPPERLSATGGWSTSSQNDPRHGHILLWGHPGCSKSRSELSSSDQQALGSAGWPWDCLCWITECVYAHCAPVPFSAPKQQPEEARLNTKGIFIIIVQMENTYQVTGCPSFLQINP